jgi:NTP pyrophosphatase (non-canonical NTP hydrolase)
LSNPADSATLPGREGCLPPLMSYRDLYQATLRKWGEAAQYDQAVEECAELITTLKHLRRGRSDETAVAEELADVYLMVGQLTFMLGEAQVAAAIERKLARLQALLAEP